MKYSQSTIELIRSMYCDHTAKEIAESMGISITTVYNLVYKHGIKSLRSGLSIRNQVVLKKVNAIAQARSLRKDKQHTTKAKK